jgi:hypothetical protein
VRRLPYGQRSVSRRSSTRFGLIAALAALVACVVSPTAGAANFTITPGGSAVTVTISTSGNTATGTFTGAANQRVSLQVTNVTITSSKVSILKPNGQALFTPFTVTKTGYFMDVKTLPVAGTYKIVVDPKDTYTGKMTLRLYNVPADPTTPATVDGTPYTVTTTTPGQNALLTFSGTAGQRVSGLVSDVDYASAKLRILNPDSSLLFSPALAFGHGGNFLEPKTLPATGTYTVLIDPGLAAVGSATIQLFTALPDSSGTITACSSLPCTPTTTSTTTAGQNAALTFNGTAGQKISLLAGNSTYGMPIKVSVLKPDSSNLFNPSLTVGGFDAFADVQTLDATGVYTIFVDPQWADAGGIDLQLYTVPADQTGAIAFGTPLTATTTMPGQNALFTFNGTLNQRVSLNLTNVTYGSAKVSILKPDKTQLALPLFVPNTLGDFQEPVKLPVAGQYTVKVDPTGASTGSLDVNLYSVPNDFTASLSSGVAKTVVISTPGQNAVLTYAGTAGQRIAVMTSNGALGDSDCCGAKLSILRPDGTTLVAPLTFGNSGVFIDTKTLNLNGTYKIKVNPIDETVGQFDLTLYLVPADAAVTAGALTSGGTSSSVTTTAPGQSARVSFSGTANGRFAFTLVSFGTGGFCGVKISVLKPDGSTLTSNQCASDGDFFDTKVLPMTGTYKIVLDPQGTRTGTANLTLYAVPADIVTTLGGSAVTLTPGQNAYLSFAATSGQTATVTPSAGGSVSLARAALYKADKTTQVGGAEYWDPSGGVAIGSLIPATATYYLKYDPIGAASGTSMTFTLSFS